MTDWLDQVRAGYDADPEAEWRRLDRRVQNRIEYLITMHILDTYLPSRRRHPRVLDAGGGPGRYTIAQAEQGYRMTLLDLSPANVDLARQRIAEAGPTVAARVEQVVEGSFTDLSMFPDGGFDAVLCLGGALSHVMDVYARLRAVAELRRVARPGAKLIISVGNILSGLRALVQWPYLWQETGDFWQDLLARVSENSTFPHDALSAMRGSAGNLANGAPYYEFMPEEFRTLLGAAGLTVVNLYGCQGIAAHLPSDNLEALMADPERWPIWRQWLLATCDDPNLIGFSCHLIAVAR